MAIVISNARKKEFLKEFHQFFNITLRSWKEYKDSFSHNKKWDDYQNVSRETILNKYTNTTYTADKTGICTRVIDGDTLIFEDNERIRLVGVNTPEKGIKGADVSTKVVEKLCLNKTIKIKIDSKKNYDKYGRTLAVVIVDDKNLNEILLKEGLAEVMYIPPSEFNPSEWGGTEQELGNTILDTNLNYQFMNVVIPFEQICSLGYGIQPFLQYFNEDFSNIIVTDSQDFNKIYKVESYKKCLFIRIDPINVLSDDLTINITLHLLPKKYDGTDSILIFKDDTEFLKEKGLVLNHDTKEEYYKKHVESLINSYYQSGLNGENRDDRYHINDNDYPAFDKLINKTKKYHDFDDDNEWIEENWTDLYDIYTEFDCDISSYTGGLRNLQIDVKYKYNDSSPTNAIHYLGAKDTSNYDIADRCALIDANLDNIIMGKTTTNYISQFEKINGEVEFPRTLRPIQQDNSYTHNHTDNIGITHFKTIKYFNDRLYSEEKNIDEDSEIINQGYTIGDWKDWDQ